MNLIQPKLGQEFTAYLVVALLFATSSAYTDERNAEFPPEIPFGLDSYRMWEKWPLQRLGVRAYMRSTYDRTGHNSDASNFIYQQAENFNVTLDVEGQGSLYFVRTNHWHGSPWHYEIDGIDHIVQETTTANPMKKLEAASFLPEELFPFPLTLTYEQTKGADLNWLPMPFEEHLRLAYSRTFYGTGYYIYHLIAPGARTTSPIQAWDGQTPPDPAVLELLSQAGNVPYENSKILGKEYEGSTRVQRSKATTIADLGKEPTVIQRISFDVPREQAEDFGDVRLRITWDNRAYPSIDAPMNLFFGAGTLHNNDDREWLVKALPVSIQFKDDRVYLNCYFPMPFFQSAKVELVGVDSKATISDINWSLETIPYVGPWNHVGYFHATFKDHGKPTLGQDLVFLDTQGAEGSDEWSGSFVGTSFVFTDRNVLTTLEGDPRFFFDDSRTPHAQGTGTEEWGGGGDYWGGRTMTQALVGHPVGVISAKLAKSPADLVHSAYRFLLADLMPFGKRALIRFDHGGENESSERYKTVTYWYGLPSPSLILTDELNVGNASSEVEHKYASPDSDLHEVTSRFEWGPDHVPLAMGEPVASPNQKITYEFNAPKGKYHVWLETKLSDEFFTAGSSWLEFNDDIGSGERNVSYMSAWGFMNFGSQSGKYQFGNGSFFSGCDDNPYSSLLPGSVVEFTKGGKQTLQIQPRAGQMEVGRILLSKNRSCRPALDFDLADDEILLSPDQATEIVGYTLQSNSSSADASTLIATTPPEALEVFPEETHDGRVTTSETEFTVSIHPDNVGVMLRRTLDYQFAHQRARVYVKVGNEWADAGIWYTAGSNTYYRSWPKVDSADDDGLSLLSPAAEIGASQPVPVTSNRRLRDDEFLLPIHHTQGRSEITIRIVFEPRNPPMLPGHEPAETAWTELEYKVYSYVMPTVSLN